MQSTNNEPSQPNQPEIEDKGTTLSIHCLKSTKASFERIAKQEDKTPSLLGNEVITQFVQEKTGHQTNKHPIS